MPLPSPELLRRAHDPQGPEMEEVFRIFPILRTAAEHGVSVQLEPTGHGCRRLRVQSVYVGTCLEVMAVAEAAMKMKGAS